jgi:hypothetical protein
MAVETAIIDVTEEPPPKRSLLRSGRSRDTAGAEVNKDTRLPRGAHFNAGLYDFDRRRRAGRRHPCRAVGSRTGYRPKSSWPLGRARDGPRVRSENQRMLREEKPDLVLAFPGGKGTAGMVALARS